MAERNDGGPAYPHLGLYLGADGNLHPTPTQHCGMSLRDWFAGQALAGIGSEFQLRDERSHWAKMAYEIADAMLAEREKPHG